MKMLQKLGIGLVVLLALASVGFSLTWTPLKNQPSFALPTMRSCSLTAGLLYRIRMPAIGGR
jgi:hypothetical protein